MTAVLYRVRIPEDAPTCQAGAYVTRRIYDGLPLVTWRVPAPMQLGLAETLRRDASGYANEQGIYLELEEAI